MYTSTWEKIEFEMLFTWVTTGTGTSCSSSSVSTSALASSWCFFFKFFAFVSFVTTTFDIFGFQSQIRLTQINVIVPIGSKFKLYAILIEWGIKIDFLFEGRQEIVNYWDFPSKVPRNCYKRLVLKITRHD